MESIFKTIGDDVIIIGTIEKGEHGGWFAYSPSEIGEESESFWKTKREAIAAVNRNYKNGKNSR